MRRLLAAVMMSLAMVQFVHGGNEQYQVQSGDTLWRISGREMSDPFLWIDLWKINPSVRNPHWIYPGDLLNLPRPARSEKASAPAAPAAVEEVLKPLELTIYTEPAQEVTLPGEAPRQKKHLYVLEGAELERLAYYTDRPLKSPYAILSAGELAPKFATERMRVIVSGGELAGLARGKRYQILRHYRDLVREDSKVPVGYLYSRVGELVVDNDPPELADRGAATVVKSFVEVMPGDLVISIGEHLAPEVVLRKTSKFVKGTVLASQDSMFFISDHQFVFLDKGAMDEGLMRGDVLRLQRDDDDQKEGKGDLGMMVVVRAWDYVSAAYVIEAREAMRMPGIRFSSYITK